MFVAQTSIFLTLIELGMVLPIHMIDHLSFMDVWPFLTPYLLAQMYVD